MMTISRFVELFDIAKLGIGLNKRNFEKARSTTMVSTE